jgi:predicted HicB family RNase H-like nuclease
MRKTDTQRRSAERRAGVLIRLSAEQRAALNAAAAERGISVQELAEQRLRPVITKQLRSA